MSFFSWGCCIASDGQTCQFDLWNRLSFVVVVFAAKSHKGAKLCQQHQHEKTLQRRFECIARMISFTESMPIVSSFLASQNKISIGALPNSEVATHRLAIAGTSLGGLFWVGVLAARCTMDGQIISPLFPLLHAPHYYHSTVFGFSKKKVNPLGLRILKRDGK